MRICIASSEFSCAYRLARRCADTGGSDSDEFGDLPGAAPRNVCRRRNADPRYPKACRRLSQRNTPVGSQHDFPPARTLVWLAVAHRRQRMLWRAGMNARCAALPLATMLPAAESLRSPATALSVRPLQRPGCWASLPSKQLQPEMQHYAAHFRQPLVRLGDASRLHALDHWHV